MKPHSRRYAPTKASIICLVALQIGPLVKEGRIWRFGRRFFSAATVNELIEAGLAIRNGDLVFAVR